MKRGTDIFRDLNGCLVTIIRRNRMGDMICALPIFARLKEVLPGARLRIVCDPAGASIAAASPPVDEVISIKKGINRLHTAWRNRAAVRGSQVVINAKIGFDTLAARLASSSRAPWRIGFEAVPRGRKSKYYTHPLPLPATPL